MRITERAADRQACCVHSSAVLRDKEVHKAWRELCGGVESSGIFIRLVTHLFLLFRSIFHSSFSSSSLFLFISLHKFTFYLLDWYALTALNINYPDFAFPDSAVQNKEVYRRTDRAVGVPGDASTCAEGLRVQPHRIWHEFSAGQSGLNGHSARRLTCDVAPSEDSEEGGELLLHDLLWNKIEVFENESLCIHDINSSKIKKGDAIRSFTRDKHHGVQLAWPYVNHCRHHSSWSQQRSCY